MGMNSQIREEESNFPKEQTGAGTGDGVFHIHLYLYKGEKRGKADDHAVGRAGGKAATLTERAEMTGQRPVMGTVTNLPYHPGIRKGTCDIRGFGMLDYRRCGNGTKVVAEEPVPPAGGETQTVRRTKECVGCNARAETTELWSDETPPSSTAPGTGRRRSGSATWHSC